jgi:PAS domain S-box-containing protein
MKIFASIFSKIFSPSKISRISLNKDGSVLTWNDQMEQVEGYKATEVLGKKISYFFSSLDTGKQSMERMLKVTLKKGISKHRGIHFRKDGSIFRGSIILKAVMNEKKELIGFDMDAVKF